MRGDPPARSFTPRVDIGSLPLRSGTAHTHPRCKVGDPRGASRPARAGGAGQRAGAKGGRRTSHVRPPGSTTTLASAAAARNDGDTNALRRPERTRLGQRARTTRLDAARRCVRQRKGADSQEASEQRPSSPRSVLREKKAAKKAPRGAH